MSWDSKAYAFDFVDISFGSSTQTSLVFLDLHLTRFTAALLMELMKMKPNSKVYRSQNDSTTEKMKKDLIYETVW